MLRISPWHSLRTRATVFTLAVFVLGIWMLTLYATRLLRADMERMLGTQQFQAVSAMADGAAAQRLARVPDPYPPRQPHAEHRSRDDDVNDQSAMRRGADSQGTLRH